MITPKQPEVYAGIERRASVRTREEVRPSAAVRRDLELLMDETLEESFPASDPPAWGSAAARLRGLEGKR
jgi:hypothetical protein